MNKLIAVGTALFVLVVGGTYLASQSPDSPTAVSGQSPTAGLNLQHTAVVHKSPSCGCCLGHVEAMEQIGIKTDVIATDDMDSIKAQHGIDPDHQACHTTIMDDYFIEGHVPLEAIQKLMTSQPKIDGIGLPRMPSGSPGMPGPKHEPYEIYQLVDGTFSSFMTI